MFGLFVGLCESETEEDGNIFGMRRHASPKLLPFDYTTKILDSVGAVPRRSSSSDQYISVQVSKLLQLLPTKCPLCGAGKRMNNKVSAACLL